MADAENRQQALKQLACLWTLSRAGPKLRDCIVIVVGKTELSDIDVMEFSAITSITINGITPQGREIHVSSSQYQELRWEIHPRELYERDREKLIDSATAA